MTPSRTGYCGRFAPSPSGPLHFGSVVAAAGSYLDARSHGGEWHVRMDNLDPPREVAGAADDILRTLDRFGFAWDGPVVFQSERTGAYEQAFAQLRENGLVYPCGCTRREIADSSLGDQWSLIYPGTCRNGLPPGKRPRAYRVRCENATVSFHDRLQGETREVLEQTAGDFVVRRADGLFAYQLAVVIDDAALGVTHVVRGADLLDSTGRQIYLQQSLRLPTPEYLHLPVAVNSFGLKLSKQTLAAPVNEADPVAVLHAALRFLGQEPPEALTRASLATLWEWAITHWQPDRLPQSKTCPASFKGEYSAEQR